MILQNAHDGTRAYRIDAGLYRLVCRNGLVVADAAFSHVAIRHVDVSAEKFAAAAQSVAENTPRVLEVIARWQAVQLNEDSRREFARRAVALRWEPVTRLMPANRLLEPVRYGDRATDLWTTFNVVQELRAFLPASPTAFSITIPDFYTPTATSSKTSSPASSAFVGSTRANRRI